MKLLLRISTQMLLLCLFGLSFASLAAAGPLNDWHISCGVDEGSIKTSGKTWVFKSSRNYCEAGFPERSEITSGNILPSHKGSYLFRTEISMLTQSSEPFSIFQIHDARDGCAPPLKVNVSRQGRLEIQSDIKYGPGDTCKKLKLGADGSRNVIRRDGVTQLLEVLVSFDGEGGFDFWVKVDGRTELSGSYKVPDGKNFFKSKKFYFKHGVYAKYRFDYVLTSNDLSTSPVRLSE